jgi:hypothetical protein
MDISASRITLASFALILSKAVLRMPFVSTKQGRGFDKLSLNGEREDDVGHSL